jgi:hypothetical protein
MKRVIALLLTGSFLSSCATITRGRDEVISVESNPPGASVTIQCDRGVSAAGVTPAHLTIPRKADLCRVNVEKSGMKAQTVPIERGFNASYWLNFPSTLGLPIYVFAVGPFGGSNGTGVAWLAFGLAGAAGLLVDRVNGAMYDHDPKVIKVTLQPEH